MSGINGDNEIRRCIVIVLDGVGIGEAPDAAAYGDTGSNSLANTARVVGGLKVPNMQALGLGNISIIPGVLPQGITSGAYGKMQELSAGKDSVTGHWELMGIHTKQPFPTYPDGFPPEVIQRFTELTGLEVLGNKAASGTEIIRELGEEHVRTGKPIVYTSADSVFQIAAHEEVIPLPELYRICEISRQMLTGEHAVGRVIARPFLGQSADTFQRTEHRRDYPLLPETPTMLDRAIEAGYQVCATGKIDDLFGHRGVSKTHHTVDNTESVEGLLRFLEEDFTGIIMSNLIEFDMIYGHRNDPAGYARKLEEFDAYIPRIQALMRPTDVAMIVADHGVDPTTLSAAHSREYIPLLVFGPRVRGSVNLGTRSTFADVAASIAEWLDLPAPAIGQSFAREVIV